MDFTPSAWQLWIIAALIAGGLEIKLSGFVMLWFAVGGLVAALVAALGLGLNLQLAAFTAVSLALFAGSRTIFKRFFMRGAADVKTGVEAMMGQEAVVTEQLGEPHGGTVRINGELWSARSLGGPVGAGELVVVERVEGLKLWVRRPSAALEVPVNKKKEKTP